MLFGVQNSTAVYLQRLNSPWLTLTGRNMSLRHHDHVRTALDTVPRHAKHRVVQSAPPGGSGCSAADDAQHCPLAAVAAANRSATPARLSGTRMFSLPQPPAASPGLGYHGNAATNRKSPLLGVGKQSDKVADHKKARSIVVKLPSSLTDHHIF